MTLLTLLASLAFAGEPRLPVPERVAPATYPAAPLAAGREATVLLEVDVAADGSVLDARVIEPAGDGFDEAAVQAILASRFEPALDADGNPAAARIQYRYRFTLDAVAPRSVEGVVSGPSGAVAGASVVARQGDVVARALTDDQGAFVLSGLADGGWDVVVDAPGLVPAEATVTVVSGDVATVAVRLQAPPSSADDDEVVTVTAERPTVEVGARALTKDEIRVLPGSNGDVVRAVQDLPGVARPPLNIGQLIIRGTPPEDSAAFFDGARVPIVFHFAGLSTIVNGQLVDEVAYLPGNAPVRYGRILGGLVDLRTSDRLPDGPAHSVAVDVFQSTVFSRDRLGKHAALTVSARRSYIDAVLTPILSKGDLTVRAPRYYDGQARLQVEDAAGGVWDGWILASNDAFKVLGDDGQDVSIGLQDTFWRGRVDRRGPLRPNGAWANEASLAFGPDVQQFQFQVDGQAYEKTWGLQLREEISKAPRGLAPGVRLGLDAEAGRDSYLYDVPSFGPKEQGEAWRVSPALYGEGTFDLGDLTVVAGVRGDLVAWKDVYTGTSVDPRLTARYQLTDAVALTGGVGRYSKLPTLRQVLPSADGNPDLGPSRSLQSSLGVEVAPADGVTASATAFYDRLSRLVVGREDRLRFFTGPPPVGPLDTGAYANDGTGLVCGTEALVKVSRREAIGLLSVTLSHSERTKRPGDDPELFEYDQPVVVNAVASQGLPKGWRLGSRLRYGSGNPYTPVVNRFYDLSSRTFVPVYGEKQSGRLPPFFSVDVRVDKTWTFRTWQLDAYLDVENATYAKNVEVMSWTYDYGAADPITGLPPTPTFGLEARF